MSQYWEYYVLPLRWGAETLISELANTLDRAGQDQWELVQIIDSLAIFKRPCPYYGEPCDPDASRS